MTFEANVPEPPAITGGLDPRYETLIRLAKSIRSLPDEKDLFDTLASELHRAVPFDGISQLDSGANRVRWRFVEPYNQKAATNPNADIPREETVAWWVYQHQQPLLIPFVNRETRFPKLMKVLSALEIGSVYALPLSTAHRQLGSLVLFSRFEGAYSAEDQCFLSLIANQVAVAMDDAHAQQRLRFLLDFTSRLMTRLELHDLLQEISAGIRQVMQCDGVGVLLPDAETGELRVSASDFPAYQKITGGRLAWELAEKVFRTGRCVKLTKGEIAQDPALAANGLNSLCGLPLVSRGRVLGVLGLSSSRENAFAEEDIAFLEDLARQTALAVENASAYGQISELKEKLARENVYLESELRSELHFEDIVGNSKSLRHVLKEVETVAPTDSTVLIYGETGTGKELIARALHNLSARKSSPFVKLNCAAIPTGLLESELFGHEKGAFTGAITQRIGRFELANHGTIFLDEIGDIPLDLQPKLLRVLQEREFERLGSTRTLRMNARLIAATNRDLKAMMEKQKFRSDLYYRLNVFPIRVPALRERKEDIPLLVRHFVQEFSRRNHRRIDTIPSETMEGLVRYHWPGNIRELQNVIERAVIISKGPVLKVSLREFEPKIRDEPSSIGASSKTVPRQSLQEAMEEMERVQILRALEETNGVVAGPNGAAARLGVKRSTLHLKMRKLGIRLSRTAIDARKRTAE